MKSFILDGSSPDDPVAININRCLLKLLEPDGASVTRVALAGQDIKGCIGCLNCFFKTPGKCHFDDIARELPHHYVDSDLAVFITPVTFGGFSSVFARAYNRMMIQLESHLVETINGELLRKKRYGRAHPAVMVIGMEKEPDPDAEGVFTALVSSNAMLHLRAPKHSVAYVASDFSESDIARTISESLAFVRS